VGFSENAVDIKGELILIESLDRDRIKMFENKSKPSELRSQGN